MGKQAKIVYSIVSILLLLMAFVLAFREVRDENAVGLFRGECYKVATQLQVAVLPYLRQ